MADKKEEKQRRMLGPVKGLLGVLVLVILFLLVMAGVTFLIHFIME